MNWKIDLKDRNQQASLVMLALMPFFFWFMFEVVTAPPSPIAPEFPEWAESRKEEIRAESLAITNDKSLPDEQREKRQKALIREFDRIDDMIAERHEIDVQTYAIMREDSHRGRMMREEIKRKVEAMQ